jgi:NDP-sugar pyrophosphorylase family protein
MIPALVLTAGLATRLRPLSRVRAKAAPPVAGTPIAVRILRQLAGAGVGRLTIIDDEARVISTCLSSRRENANACADKIARKMKQQSGQFRARAQRQCSDLSYH